LNKGQHIFAASKELEKYPCFEMIIANQQKKTELQYALIILAKKVGNIWFVLNNQLGQCKKPPQRDGF
jgi:hypothetical protein